MNVWDGTSDRRDIGSSRAPDRVDWDQMIAEMQLAQKGFNGIDPVTLQSVGAVATKTGLSVAEYGDGAMHKTVLTLASVSLASTDGSTSGTDGAWASQLLYTFPTGRHICALAYFKLDSLEANPGADGFTSTSDFDLGIGSVASAQETIFGLTGTQADYGEATVALSGSASTDDTNTQTSVVNLTTTGLYLNLRTVDDADHGVTAGALEVTGVIVLTWTMVD